MADEIEGAETDEPTFKDRVEDVVEEVIEVAKKADKIADSLEPVVEKVMPVVEAVVSAAVPGASLVFQGAKTAARIAKPAMKSFLGAVSADDWQAEGEDGWVHCERETNEKLGLVMLTSKMKVGGSTLVRVVTTNENGSLFNTALAVASGEAGLSDQDEGDDAEG